MKRRDALSSALAAREPHGPGTLYRRAMMSCVGALFLWPGAVHAQPAARRWRIGFLSDAAGDAPLMRSVVEAFRQGLRELGHVEGRTHSIDFRFADKHERLAGMANELLQLPVDVIVAAFPAPALVARDVTRTMAIVAISVDDPVSMGLAETLARPGGNVTGISGWGSELVAKRLQLLRELLPAARRFGILINPNAATPAQWERFRPEIAAWSQTLGVDIRLYSAKGPDEFDGVFAALARDRVDGLLVLADANSYTHRARLNTMCLQHKMPSVWGGRDFLTGGAIASYQSDIPAMFKRGAALVDKILKGEKPGTIPFERSTKLELIVDSRAAKALGVAVPQSLLLSADEVIQ